MGHTAHTVGQREGRISKYRGLPSAKTASLIAICANQCDYRRIGCLAWEVFPMPYYIEFDPANRVLRGRFEGKITDETLKESYLAAGRYAAQTTPRAAIMDLLAVTSFDVIPETIRELASLPPAISDRDCPRFIVASSPQIFGMARMFELKGQDTRPNLHVVRSMKEVCAILAIPEFKFEPITAGAFLAES
jgi:hypothetical protein